MPYTNEELDKKAYTIAYKDPNAWPQGMSNLEKVKIEERINILKRADPNLYNSIRPIYTDPPRKVSRQGYWFGGNRKTKRNKKSKRSKKYRKY